MFKSTEVKTMFNKMAEGKDKMTSHHFVSALSLEPLLKTDGVRQELLSRIQEWILKRMYTAEDAFNRLTVSAQKS